MSLSCFPCAPTTREPGNGEMIPDHANSPGSHSSLCTASRGKMQLLCDLPISLLHCILSEWVVATNLATLDTACCSTASRETYLNAVRLHPLAMTKLPALRMRTRTRLMSWIVKRGLTVRQFEICGEYKYCTTLPHPTSHKSQAETKAFFDAVGARLETLSTDCDSEATCALEFASRKCTQLKILSVNNSQRERWDMSPYLQILLSACARTLERLGIRAILLKTALPPFTLPKLRYLHLVDAHCEEGCLSASLWQCPLLESFLCTDLNGEDSCLEALAAHCPLLKVLGFANSSSETGALIQLLQACPLIEVVDLAPGECDNPTVNDEHVEAIARHGANIRALRITTALSDEVTQVALASLAQTRRLTRLLISYVSIDSDVALQLLASSAHFCANIEELSLIEIEGDFTIDAIAALVSSLYRLRVLRIKNCDLICPRFARALGKCPALEILQLSCCADFSQDDVVALAESCTALRVLHIDDTITQVCTPVAQQLWQLLRPQLQISTVHAWERADPDFWHKLTDLTRTENVTW